MPAALDVDREQVRMLVQSVGCSEAARQTGLNLNTVLQWSSRFGWLKALQKKPELPPSMRQPVINVISPANAHRNVIVGGMIKTRENHVFSALAVSETLREKSGEELLENVDKLLAAGKHAALVGGWNADSRPDSPGKAFGSRNSGLEIDAEVLDAPQPEENADIPPIPDGVSTNVDDY